MPQEYNYQALNNQGDQVNGSIFADNEAKAIIQLRSQGLYPMKVAADVMHCQDEQHLRVKAHKPLSPVTWFMLGAVSSCITILVIAVAIACIN